LADTLEIDSELISCAEYQLFLDEAGKNFQPEHWPDSVFPKGTANQPVLGVRGYQANKFCEWLSQRTGEHFRLPAFVEIKTAPALTGPVAFWYTHAYQYGLHWPETDNSTLVKHIAELNPKLTFRYHQWIEQPIRNSKFNSMLPSYCFARAGAFTDTDVRCSPDNAEAFEKEGLDSFIDTNPNLADTLALAIDLGRHLDFNFEIIRNIHLGGRLNLFLGNVLHDSLISVLGRKFNPHFSLDLSRRRSVQVIVRLLFSARYRARHFACDKANHKALLAGIDDIQHKYHKSGLMCAFFFLILWRNKIVARTFYWTFKTL
jgi:hypothetical protein